MLLAFIPYVSVIRVTAVGLLEMFDTLPLICLLSGRGLDLARAFVGGKAALANPASITL